MTTEFFIGIASSIIASLLILAAIRSARRWGRAILSLPSRLRRARYFDESGLLYFFSSRSDYQIMRGTATQAEYFRLADRSIEMVGHSFNYGQHSQGIANELEDILRVKPSLEVVLALLDPGSSHVGSLARYMSGSVEGSYDSGSKNSSETAEAERRLRADIVKTLSAFQTAREKMPRALSARLTIKVYQVLPIASVIMIDRSHDGGRTQVDLKLFGAPYHQSVSFEVGNNSSLYKAVTAAWGRIVDTAVELDPAKHLVDMPTPAPVANPRRHRQPPTAS